MSERQFDQSYFDLQAWELVDDEIAVKRVDAGDETIRHIGELLLADELPDEPEGIPARRQMWTRDEMLRFGHWIVQAINDVGESAQTNEQDILLAQNHVLRASKLDVGPSWHWVRVHFGTMWGYREALGLHAGRALGKFDHWSRQNYVEHTARLERRLGRRPRREDFDASHHSSKGKWPTSDYIIEHVDGGLSALYEAIGYPDVESWDEADYIAWGVQALEANDGELNSIIVTHISKQDRGPSITTIAKYFGTLRSFKKQSTETWQQQQNEEAMRQLQLLKNFITLRRQQILPPELDELDHQERIAVAAKYQLAEVCLPWKMPDVHAKLAQTPTNLLIQQIQFHNHGYSRLSAGIIEDAASARGLYDEIWPAKGYMKYLKVPEEVILMQHQKDRDRMRAKKAASNGGLMKHLNG